MPLTGIELVQRSQKTVGSLDHGTRGILLNRTKSNKHIYKKQGAKTPRDFAHFGSSKRQAPYSEWEPHWEQRTCNRRPPSPPPSRLKRCDSSSPASFPPRMRRCGTRPCETPSSSDLILQRWGGVGAVSQFLYRNIKQQLVPRLD